ncbi:MAG TPA: hypothetical protein VF897_21275 [Roseiflexaceae bacterium]
MTTVRFPDLQVVPIEQCLLHEETDGARVARLSARLAADGVLRNPPILGRHEGVEQLIVLDGATRVTALGALGVPHIVAQVVDYDDDAIQLQTWSHVLSGLSLDDLRAALADEPALAARPCTPYEAENALAHRETLAYLAGGDGRCLALGHSADLVARAAALRRLFAAYAGRATIARFPPAEWPVRLDEHGACVAVVYPTYAKRDLVALALAGAVLPAGITRHVIPGRALRINAPINQRPLAEKQAWLAGWLRDHQAGHHVRFYVEPTYLFDE